MARGRGPAVDSSPIKRRKISKAAFSQKQMEGVVIQWPLGQLPVELFEIIVSYLPRSSVQNMRIVNKEFESKVSAYLFKVVVVPFKPEIYGITPEPALSDLLESQTNGNEILRGAIMLQDKGMRVFQGFGGHIKKFAMSFEYDEKKLTNPPLKSDQEAIKAFWGIYRWPFKKYNRYSQLEGLEQTADETRTMAKALRYIDQACELGLSIDGGLGWLSGPDTNARVAERGGKVSVFGTSKFEAEEQPRLERGKDRAGWASSHAGLLRGQHATFQRMLEETGLNGDDLEAGVQMMIEAEHMTENISHWQDDMAVPSTGNADASVSYAPALSQIQEDLSTSLDSPYHGPAAVSSDRLLNSDDEDNGDSDREPGMDSEPNLRRLLAVNVAKTTIPKAEGHPLKPNDLTNAQREMLLEIEWAQRAFMQSYAIAIIDNPKTFFNISTLTIARIPHRHLPIIRREDFWDGLPQLSKLSLAVIPDWRDVIKLPTSYVQDIKLPPSQSIPGVFQLLGEQISRRKNITTFHFEWICGGEEAPGLFARNQHVLAAPLVSKAMEMVDRSTIPQLLPLPHVQHLSLKNCWISPHMLLRLGLSMKKQSLQTLSLESVSLTASLAPNSQPTPLMGHAPNNQQAVNHALNVMQNAAGAAGAAGAAAAAPLQILPPGGAFAALAIPPASMHNSVVPAWLDPPRAGSWASVINTLTPGRTIAHIRYARRHDQLEPVSRNTGSISTLNFKSCGYVRLPLDFDQSSLDPPANAQSTHNSALSKRISDLDPFMMKPPDPTLGIIVSHISDTEIATLENVFNMNLGWGNDRHALIAEATADGVLSPGQGRFSGII